MRFRFPHSAEEMRTLREGLPKVDIRNHAHRCGGNEQISRKKKGWSAQIARMSRSVYWRASFHGPSRGAGTAIRELHLVASIDAPEMTIGTRTVLRRFASNGALPIHASAIYRPNLIRNVVSLAEVSDRIAAGRSRAVIINNKIATPGEFGVEIE
jgi:hypothetical protein